jgi:hypothetical protein
MKQNSMGPGRRANRLSTSILRITRSGPKETNFVIVDVPGLVRGRCDIFCENGSAYEE